MINWKLRLQNKVTLTAIILGVVGIIYQVLGLFGVVPTIAENDVIQVINLVIELLVLLGVVVDPTTSGIKDSAQAMTYDEPRV